MSAKEGVFPGWINATSWDKNQLLGNLLNIIDLCHQVYIVLYGAMHESIFKNQRMD